MKVYLISCIFLLFLSCTNTPNKSLIQEKTYSCSLCPKLGSNTDTLAFVSEVQRFVAANTPMGKSSSVLCDTFYKIPFNQFPTDTFFNLFKQEKGAASCGLISKIMVKVLLDNHIDAYTYNFGFQNERASHVVVLVKQKNKFLIYDPHIGYELMNQHDQHLDLETLIHSIGNKNFIPVFKSDTTAAKVLLAKEYIGAYDLSKYGDTCNLLLAEKLKQDKSENIIVETLRCYNCEKMKFCKNFTEIFEEKLQANTSFNHFFEGFLLKINDINGADDSYEVNAYFDSIIQEKKISLGMNN